MPDQSHPSKINPEGCFNPPKPMKRPFAVTILIVVVLIFTSLNILRMITAIRTWDTLAASPVRVPVIYLVITGAVWGAVGFPLVLGLYTRREWSLYLARGAIGLYVGYYWFDRLFIADRSAIASRWQFILGFTIILGLFLFWVLAHPKTRAYLSQ
ncbi:MAG: hypothetical protein MUO62_01525 [Anaerolineales bacterium]|nr:hypothetical protein [Anaerolineales bacterium]